MKKAKNDKKNYKEKLDAYGKDPENDETLIPKGFYKAQGSMSFPRELYPLTLGNYHLIKEQVD